MSFTPLNKIIPKKWNDEFFEKAKTVLTPNEAVAICIIGSNPPSTGKSGFYLMTPPGIGKEFVVAALKTAIKQLEAGEPNRFFDANKNPN